LLEKYALRRLKVAWEQSEQSMTNNRQKRSNSNEIKIFHIALPLKMEINTRTDFKIKTRLRCLPLLLLHQKMKRLAQ